MTLNLNKADWIQKAKEEAAKEFEEEQVKAAKTKIKSKMAELTKAKKVVRNLERELEDLYDELSEG